jgi:hypothetical protein
MVKPYFPNWRFISELGTNQLEVQYQDFSLIHGDSVWHHDGAKWYVVYNVSNIYIAKTESSK